MRIQTARGDSFKKCGLDLCHFDVDQAFVQSDHGMDVFLRYPKRCDDLAYTVD